MNISMNFKILLFHSFIFKINTCDIDLILYKNTLLFYNCIMAIKLWNEAYQIKLQTQAVDALRCASVQDKILGWRLPPSYGRCIMPDQNTWT